MTKRRIKEHLNNLDDLGKNVVTPLSTATAQLKANKDKKYKEFKKITETDDVFLGAKKQPLPKPIKPFKSKSKTNLDEALFEDLDNSDYSNLRSDVYNALSDIMYKYQIKKELPISKFDMDNAINWFNDRFWAEPDEEDAFEESLKEDYSEDYESSNSSYYSEIPTTSQLVKLATSLGFKDEDEDNSPWFMNDNWFALDFYRGRNKDINKLTKAIKKYWPSFTNDVYDDGTPIFIDNKGKEVGQIEESLDTSLIEKREKVVQTPEEKAQEGDLWTTVYNELVGEWSFFKKSLGSREPKWGYKERKKQPKYEDIVPIEHKEFDTIRVYAPTEEELDFARQVADEYMLYWAIEKSREKDPNRRFYIDIDIPKEG